MELNVNNYNLEFISIYNKFIYTTPLISRKYTLPFLEINNNTIIKINNEIYEFKNFEKSDNINENDINVQFLVEQTYINKNITIATRINNNNNEEILYIIYDFPEFYKAMSQEINHVIDNIYIGNLFSSIDIDILKENNIKNIVQVIDFDNSCIDNIDYLKININDDVNTDISKYYENFINFIKNKTENILIHCQHGSSRSGSFIILYLMHFHKMSYENALKYAQSKRKCILPNYGFSKQLKNIII